MKMSKMRKRQHKFKENFININTKFSEYDKVIEDNFNYLNQKDEEMRKVIKESND